MIEPVYFVAVDDHLPNLVALEALLQREGLKVLKASSGDEALELLLRYDVALALLDVQMPDMDGFELAELMRGREKSRAVPIIFVTAESSNPQRRFQGYGAGAVDFIHKPIEPEILRSKANVFFELGRQRQEIAQQRDDLAAAGRALQEADSAKDRFLTILGHELRNPVASISSAIVLLRRPRSAEQVDEIYQQMDRMSSHLGRLIEDLLDVSRIKEGKLALQIERADLRAPLLLAIEGASHAIAAAGHALRVDLPNENVWIDGDTTRIAQASANLIVNAARYTPSGGEIGVALTIDEAAAHVTVTDNGLGIPPEMLDKIFEVFAQVDGHKGQSAGGIGIGLSLVKHICELHGGTVSVKSAGSGKGSSFTIRLPLASNAREDLPLDKGVAAC
ncbi:hybrid sensor histidine kinase/response regulator [Novosphingobium sp. YAF33]|uniref:hybrid sensor histidine kinase/response regulator n=1 Tax=Novosphingobium sp. YAF33 TaxID=3233082 RepID=UPI003F964379